jgi:hypothetical protein
MAKCPYDGFECKKLTEGFEKWRRAVNFMSANTTKLVFVTSLTMLNKCNDVTNCARYAEFMKQKLQNKKIK